MKKILTTMLFALASVGTLGFGSGAAPAQAQRVEVSISLFYENLAPHGRWIQHPRWGWAWFPQSVDAEWRPYTLGRWVWTEEYGWYWASEEPFGWAVYHYGRWANDEEYGWIWIPGSIWSPAWVAFRHGADFVGWAPLPPETLYLNVPIYRVRYTDMSAAYYRPRWVFVPVRYFMAPRVTVYVVPPARNHVYINRTLNVTNFVTVNRVLFNRSIEPQRIQAVVGRRIVPVRVQNVTTINNVMGPRNQRTQNNVVNVFRPVVRVTRDAAPPAAARANPDDRPRGVIQKEAVAPSERRDRAVERGRHNGDRRNATAPRTEPPNARSPGAPDKAKSAQPSDRDKEKPQARRDAKPGDRPISADTAPGTGPRQGVHPPPADPRNGRFEERRGQRRNERGPTPPSVATPAQPPANVPPPRPAPTSTVTRTAQPPAHTAPPSPPRVQVAPAPPPPTAKLPPAPPAAKPQPAKQQPTTCGPPGSPACPPPSSPSR